MSGSVRRALLIATALPGLSVGAVQQARAQVVATRESSIANLQAPDMSGHTVRQFARVSVGGA